MSTAAYAAEDTPKEPPVDMECIQQLIRAEKLVEGKVEAEALSEADQEKLYLLLDEADAFCTEGNAKQANKSLAAVRKMVSEAKQ
ncbi:hypothetical protein [Methyloceanibacter sp.]|uniref:hypothetical protein n=1 Tax=Methyloceanibacter sp. TaxID=1965321 RepID=UPI003D6D9B2B